MRSRSIAGHLVATLCLFACFRSSQAGAQVWDVGNTAQVGQWTLYNRTENGSEIGLPVAAGDVDGDGLDDVILTPMNADSGPGRDRPHSGEVAIVLSSGRIGGERDLALVDPAEPPSDVALIYGADERDFLGTEVWSADVDGDHFDDVIVGAQYGDGPANGRAGCGEAVIIWGGADIGGKVIDLRNPSPATAVTFVYGAESGDRFGIWAGAGDFDGDGVEDVVIGADQADGPDGLRTHAGETFVLYGGAALREQRAIDLASPGVPTTVVYGIDPEDHSGATVRTSDLDRDGAADLLIGAGLNRLSASVSPGGSLSGHGSGGGDGRDNVCDPVGFTCHTGEAYVIYGQIGVRPDVIDLRTPPASTVFIYGIDARDAYGEELFGGDFNGDGNGDIAVGALTADGPDNSRFDGGEMALIFGGPELRGSTIELATSPANVVFFYGEFGGSIAGDTAMLTDVDGDGKDDVVLSSPTAPAGPLFKAGNVHIFFGTDEPLPQRIDLRAIPASVSVLRINGGTANDILSYSSAPGDFDGDGRADPLLNLMGGDGFDDLLQLAGDAVVLSGAVLAHAAGRLDFRCTGDCDDDLLVSASEVIVSVRIALGQSDMSACETLDADGDGAASVTELVRSVGNALEEGSSCE